MTKILLVTTSFENIPVNVGKTTEQMHYPMGLAYLHSYLISKGNEVRLLSLNHKTYEECLETIIENIKSFSPSLIGVQIITANRVSSYQAIDYIHKNYPHIKILLGGIHATIMHKQLVQKYPFSIAVLGEGEITVEELLKELFKKKPNLKKIDGIAYFDKGKAVRTKPRQLIENLDELPFPTHELFLKDKRESACLLTSRGCYFNCSFCCLNPEAKRKVRFRSPMNVVDEIEFINKRFPWVKQIWIHDDSFFINNTRVMRICDEIMRRNIKLEFICSARIKPISKEMIEKLEKTGFTKVLLGVESGARSIMISSHKNITPEEVLNAFRLFAKSSITVKPFFIVGLPGENWDTIKETKDLIKEIQKIQYQIIGDSFNLLNVYPGTEVYEIGKAKGWIDDNYWLTDKETPVYTAENSLDKLKEFEKYLSTHLSIYKIKTRDGFLKQLPMLPYAIKYFIKKKKNWNMIRNVIRDSLK